MPGAIGYPCLDFGLYWVGFMIFLKEKRAQPRFDQKKHRKTQNLFPENASCG